MPRGRGGRGGRGQGRWGGQNGFEEWGGYMAAKKAKLENQFALEAKKEGEDDDGNKGIFHGVAIFVNGYTDPSADELKRIMMMNGGIFHHYFNPAKTTHMIASNLPDTKVKALKGNEPICKTEWIVDSLAAGKLLDYRNYLLYSAQNKSQPKISFKGNPKEIEQSGKKTLNANDSRFLGEFYNNSRLHHISQMGANFKRYVNELREKKGGNVESTFPMRDELKKIKNNQTTFERIKRMIMHIDMDCFFVSVGLRKRPELKGKPVAVAHAKGAKPISPDVAAVRKAEMDHYKDIHGVKISSEPSKDDTVEFSSMSELASCSYEARAKGVKNGMFLGSALKLCPDLKTIPYDFDGYQEVAYCLYDTVAQFTLDVQAVSCDEMLVDITDIVNECQIQPIDFAEHLRNLIFQKTQCHASVGLGSSLLLARMATKKAKPNGVYRIPDEEAADFMKAVSVRDLPGIGRKTARRFDEMKISTCEQLQQISLRDLQREFGQKNGESYYRFCRGIDDRNLNMCQERKSVSAEVNYGIRFKTQDDCTTFFDQLCSEVHGRMERLGVRGKSITLKLMIRAADAPVETSKFMGHGICDSLSKTSTLSTATDDLQVIKREVKILLRQMAANIEDMRGIGIQVSKLEGNTTGLSNSGIASNNSRGGNKSILSFVRKDAERKDLSRKRKNDEENKEESEPVQGPELSFSQVDPSVLNELPPDIRNEIEVNLKRNKNKQKPDILTESSTSNIQPLILNADKSLEPKPCCSKDVLLRPQSPLGMSFSQVDPEYLKALPDDIRKEIEEDYNLNAKKRLEEKRVDESQSKSCRSLTEVTFSQVDPEYLSALPEDIAEEVRKDLAAARAAKSPTGPCRTGSAFDKLMKASKSPTAKSASNVAKRGRPSKNSPKFKSRTISSSKSSSKATEIRSPRKDLFKEKEENMNSSSPKKVQKEIPKVKEQPNLEGKIDLEDVKKLLKTWLNAVVEPSEDDVETVSVYFQNLARNRELEKLRFLLKLLWRKMTCKEPEAKWRFAYETILDNTQEMVAEMFGFRLSTAFQNS